MSACISRVGAILMAIVFLCVEIAHSTSRTAEAALKVRPKLQAKSVSTQKPGPCVKRAVRSEGPPLAVVRFNALGKSALEQGNIIEAEQDYKKSLLLEEDNAPNSLSLAETLNGLGIAAEMRGNSVESEKHFRRALAISESVDPCSLELAASLHGLGRIALDRQDAAAAEPYLAGALALRQALAPQSGDLAASFNGMGDLYYVEGKVANASAMYQRALAIRKKASGDSLDVAESLTRIGLLHLRRRQVEMAEQYQRQALEIRESRAPGSVLVAESLVNLAYCYTSDLPKARDLANQALSIQQRVAPDSLLITKTLILLAQIDELQGNFEHAADYQQQVLAIRERLAPDSLIVGITLNDLGEIAFDRGDLDSALNYLQRASAIIEKLAPDSLHLAENLTLLGNVAYQHSDLNKAEGYYRRSLSIRQKLDPGGLKVSISLRRLGQLAAERGDLANARKYHRQALLIREKVAPGTMELANSLYDMGSIAKDEGNLVAAERYCRRALAIWSKIVPDSLYVAQGLGRLGTLARIRGQWDSSEKYLNDALSIWRKLVPGSANEGWGLSELGDIAREKHDLTSAERYYRQSLAITEKLNPASADHAQTMASLAFILRKTRPDEAELLYEKSLNSIETQMAHLGGSEEVRYEYRARYESNYRGYVELLVAQNKPGDAFEVNERLRARTLLENLVSGGVDIRKGADPALLQQQKSLQAAISEKYERRMRLLGSKHTEEELAAFDKEINRLFAQKEDVAAQIRSASPAYNALTQPSALTAQEVQEQLLDADTVLLEYSLGPERSYVFVVSKESVDVHALPKRSEIEAVARPVYDLLTARTQVRKGESETQRMARIQAAEGRYLQAANRLSRVVLGPVASYLDRKRLLIVSDGVLQYLPFNALPVPESRAEFLPLVAHHEIVDLPSASVLQVLKQQSAGRIKPIHDVAVLADPVFGANDDRVQTAKETLTIQSPKRVEAADKALRDRLRHSAAEVRAGRGGTDFPRLLFTRREAEVILEQSSTRKKRLAVDFQASRATAMSPELGDYRIIHFATHGLLNSEHPELSGLVLSLVDQQGRPQNGFLTLNDIYNLNLRADLVVLSACETGLGKEIKGEGLVGITRGFMYAGASRVVTSLWKVDDAATAELMGKFYRGMLKEGLQPAAALRNAQVQMWKHKRWNSPYYWAGFVLQGQW